MMGGNSESICPGARGEEALELELNPGLVGPKALRHTAFRRGKKANSLSDGSGSDLSHLLAMIQGRWISFSR